MVSTDASQPLAGALVGLSGHDGPPAAGPALQAVTGATGAYTISGVPEGAYPNVSVDAPSGFADADTGPLTVAGASAARDVTVRRNYADGAAGAAITSPDARNDAAWGCGWGNLIDGNEANVLETAPPDADSPQRTFDITLNAPVNGAEVWIDPSAACGTIEESGLAAYAVEVSKDGTTFTPAGDGTFEARDNGHMNRVPLKGDLDGVTKVRLVALSTQGQDPVVPLGDQGVLDIAELQVYGRPGGTPPGGGGGGGGGGTPPTPVAQLRPVLSSTKHKLTVNRKTRRVKVKLRCVKATEGTVPSTCTGRITLPGGKKRPQGVLLAHLHGGVAEDRDDPPDPDEEGDPHPAQGPGRGEAAGDRGQPGRRLAQGELAGAGEAGEEALGG